MRIIAVSDSLTNDEPGNWLALLAARLLGVACIANAHGGWTTKSFFKDKFRDVAFARVTADADLFILLVGSNNLFEDQGGSDASVAEAVEGVRKLAAHLLAVAPKARIMLVAPPTVAMKNNVLPDPKPERRIDSQSPECLRKLSESYRRLALRQGWAFVDLYPLLSEDDFIDAAHPNAAGNAKMAEAIGGVVQSLRKQEERNAGTGA